MSKTHRGRLIVVEGIEGSGKSTQATLLYEQLQENKIPSVLAREPGDTQTGETIRNALLHGEKILGMTELFLFSAARCEIIDKVIKPALGSGKIVVCDRFTASTLAYQGYGRGISLDHVSYITELSTQGLTPTLGFLLDISPEISFKRIKETTKDRIENEDLNFHHLVRQGYLDTAHSNPKLWTILDAEAPAHEIKTQIWDMVSIQLNIDNSY